MLLQRPLTRVCLLAAAFMTIACGPGEEPDPTSAKKTHKAAPTGAQPNKGTEQEEAKTKKKGPITVGSLPKVSGDTRVVPPKGPPILAVQGAGVFAGSRVITGNDGLVEVELAWTVNLALKKNSTLLIPTQGECGAVLVKGKAVVTAPKKKAPVSVCFVHTPSASLEPPTNGTLEISVDATGTTKARSKGADSYSLELHGERKPLGKGAAHSFKVEGKTTKERLVTVDKIFARLLLDVEMLTKLRDENKELLEQRRSEKKSSSGAPSEKWAALTEELSSNAEQLVPLRKAATVELMRIQAMLAMEQELPDTSDETKEVLQQTRNRLKSLAQDLPQLFSPRSR